MVPVQQHQIGGFACMLCLLQSEYAMVDSTMFWSTDDKDNKKMTIASKVYKLVVRNIALWPTAVRVCQKCHWSTTLYPRLVLAWSALENWPCAGLSALICIAANMRFEVYIFGVTHAHWERQLWLH